MIRNALRHRPVTVFFALAFGISWGGILVICAATGFDFSPLQPVEAGLIFLVMLLGPAVSGLVCTALLEGCSGARALWQSAKLFRMAPPWIALALLTVPATLMALLTLLGMLVDPAFLPRLQWQLLAVGLVAGSFEEIGWTGFATPRLIARHGAVHAGLTLGLVWAIWHLLVDFRYNFGTMGPVWPLEFAVVYMATLTPYRMLMTYVFSRVQSLGLAILMHASFTGWLMALFPSTSPSQTLVWQSAFALILWALVAWVLARSNLAGKGLLA